MVETVIENYKKQRDLLFNACRDVAINQRTPKWIIDVLQKAVIEAKKLNEIVKTDNEPIVNRPVQVGDEVWCHTLDNTTHRVLIERETDLIEGIRLFTIRVLKGAENGRKSGSIVYNIPENWLSFNRE